MCLCVKCCIVIRVAALINEIRLYLWAMILPALVVGGFGIRLLWVAWARVQDEERDTLHTNAMFYVDSLMDQLHKIDPKPMGLHGPPPFVSGTNDVSRMDKRGRPPSLIMHRPPPMPHRPRAEMVKCLEEVCEEVQSMRSRRRARTAFEVCDEDGKRLWATPDYPDNPRMKGMAYLAPPLGEGILYTARPDGGRAMRMMAIRLLALGGVMIVLLIGSLFAGGALLVRGLRRERMDALRKTNFIDNVSHELKTPLAGIRLNAELLCEGLIKDGERREQALRSILSESDRLTRMVESLLNFGRLKKHTRRYSMAPMDLAAFVKSFVADPGSTVSAGSRLGAAPCDGSVMAMADADALREVVLNLVDNAAKYSEGPIEIAVSRNDGPEPSVELSVSDRGPGIPHGEEERIFERFYRVDTSLTSKTSGSGLGLPIARALARGMGGDLKYSHRGGGGSVFTLHLKSAT